MIKTVVGNYRRLFLAAVLYFSGQNFSIYAVEIEVESLFKAGKYEEVLKALSEKKEQTAFYFYNLGTVYAKLNKFGLSVAYLEKANYLQPHDILILNNLNLSKEALGKELGGNDKLDTASDTLEKMADRVNLDEVRGILGLMGCLLLVLWIKKYRKTRRLRSTLLQPSAICTVLFLVISLFLYLIERSSRSTPPAVALEFSSIRSGPGLEYLELTKIPAGVKVRVLKVLQPEKSKINEESDLVGGAASGLKTPDSAWIQVRYDSSGPSGDGIGWVPQSSLLLF